MTDWPIPSDGEQLRFLRNIQRLLNEGSFAASYKFALLHALADLAVIKGEDSGAPLTLSTRQIADRFIHLYWQQARPFRGTKVDPGAILKQNAGRQAAVINRIAAAYRKSAGSLYRISKDQNEWNSLIRDVSKTIQIMPLWKLQTVGSEKLDFLYANTDHGETITLKPGVSYCLRAFYSLLCDLFRSAWIDYLRRSNALELGYMTDLEEFLFGQERAPLDIYKPILWDIQKGLCFYCRGNLRDTSEVDHFIPWSRCHSDLAHNLVLAHQSCNSQKSDHLAFENHLESWTMRNIGSRKEVEQLFDEAKIIHDMDSSVEITRWAYGITEQANGQVWIKRNEFKHLSSSWRGILSVTR